MNAKIKSILKTILKVAKVLAIVFLCIWLLIIILLQILLTDSFLTSTANKIIPDYVEGATVKFSRVSASALKDFPNLRISIDSLCITYPHDKWSRYDSLAVVHNRLENAGRGPVEDTLASFSSLSVSISYWALLRGTVDVSNLSFKDPRIFARQLDSLRGNWQVLKFLAPTDDTTSTSIPDLIFNKINIKGKTLGVYISPTDSIFAAFGVRNFSVDGRLSVLKPLKARLNVDIDSLFVTGRAGADTIAAAIEHLSLKKVRRYHKIEANARTFVSMGQSGRMMLPLSLEGRLRFPGGRGDKISIKDLQLMAASFRLRGSSDLAFHGDSITIKAKGAIDSCNAKSLLKDFAPLLGPEIKKFGSNADLKLSFECDGIYSRTARLFPAVKAHLVVPESVISHTDLPESGLIATDIILDIDRKGRVAGEAKKFTFKFAGAFLDAKFKAKDLLGAAQDGTLEATAVAELEKFSAFIPDSITARGRLDSKISASGGNINVTLLSDSLFYDDGVARAYLGSTDLLVRRRGLGRGKASFLVQGRVDTVLANIGHGTRIRGTEIDLAVDDMDAYIQAKRLSLRGEDSLFIGLSGSKTHVSVGTDKTKDSLSINRLALTSDNEGFILRSGPHRLGLRGVSIMTSGNKNPKRTAPPSGTRRAGFMTERIINPQDIDIRLDESIAKYFTSWSIDGAISIQAGMADSPYFPIRTRLSSFNGHFNNDEIIVDSVGLKAGQSDVGGWASVSGLRRALRRRGILNLDLFIKSKKLNANELFIALGSSGSETAIDTLALQDTLTEIPYIAIPKNINVNIGIQGDTIVFSSLTVNSYTSRILMQDGCMQLAGTTASTNMGNISLEGFYSSRSKNDLGVGFDLWLDDVTAGEVIGLIPQMDTLVPLLRSFNGMIDCEFALTSALDTNMNFVPNSITGLMQITGRDLVVDQDNAIRKITKMLKFKNKKTGNIKEMSVRGLIENTTLEIFPFDINVDRYKLAVGGVQNFDNTFKYHISVLKSPSPIKFGISVKGNFDDWSWHFCKPRYKNINTPVYVRQLDTARTNLITSIRTIFERGAALAMEEHRKEVERLGAQYSVADDSDTLSTHELLQIDSTTVSLDSLSTALLPVQDSVAVVSY